MAIVPQTVAGERKIGVIDFKAGVGILQGDVDGISAIFTTYFSPKGYTLVERAQIEQIISEQGFQSTRLTQAQMVRIGRILNLQSIVVGDVNIVSDIYNLDVRVVDVEKGDIIAKEGTSWEKGTSYRQLMNDVASSIAKQLEEIPEEIIIQPVVSTDTVIEVPKLKLEPVKPGYEQSIEAYYGLLIFSPGAIHSSMGVGLSYIGGYRFNNLLFLGLGVGLYVGDYYNTATEINNESSNFGQWLPISNIDGFYEISVPLYLHSRVYLGKRRCQPYFALSIGARLNLPQKLGVHYIPYYVDHQYGTCGFLLKPEFGFNIRMNNQASIYFKVAYDAQTYPHIVDNEGDLVNNQIIVNHKIVSGFNFGLGFTF